MTTTAGAKARQDAGTLGIDLLADLRRERDQLSSSGKPIPKTFIEKFAKLTDQLRRDFPLDKDRQIPEPASESPPADPLAGLRLVS